MSSDIKEESLKVIQFIGPEAEPPFLQLTERLAMKSDTA